MTYEDTLAYLYDRLPMFSRLGSVAMKPGLGNIEQLCHLLGDPQSTFRIIHVAGTNGKGSVSHMLASVLMASGYRTGLYTSPHLRDFRERIRIDGVMIPKEEVVSFTERIIPAIDRLSPSFFEITVAMAVQYFADAKVDAAVIETGLGGRLDSTNIVNPELSVITNIGWDHMNILGDTLPAIASEKAGIIKPGVPVVLGEPDTETVDVFIQKAKASGSELRLASQSRRVLDRRSEGRLFQIRTETQEGRQEDWVLDLAGTYQSRNLLTVLESVDVLRAKGWQINGTALKEGLRHAAAATGLQGRWQTLHENPRIVLDVAHNEPGMRELLRQLSETPHAKLHIVTGMVRDKDVRAVLALMPTKATYYFTRASIPRAMPEDELQKEAAGLGRNGHAYPNIDAALDAALKVSDKDDLILVCGSVFLVGEVDPQRYASL